MEKTKKQKKETIGEAVEKKVKEAKELYQYFSDCSDVELQKIAGSLARHDILIEKIISEMALEQIDKHIKHMEGLK